MKNEKELIYFSDLELEQLTYSREKLLWNICGENYICAEATKDGCYFMKVKII